VLLAAQCTARMNGLMKQINEHVRRRTFLLGFSQSPASFINGLLASQVTHLKGQGTRVCRCHLRHPFVRPHPDGLYGGISCGQARDLRTFKSEQADVASMYAPTRTELFHGKWIEDAVLKYTRSSF
jgi:hypothetical protein